MSDQATVAKRRSPLLDPCVSVVFQMAAALIQRISHHCHLVNMRGNSYRMRHHTEPHPTLQTFIDSKAGASDEA